MGTCVISGERLSVLPPQRLKLAIRLAFGNLARQIVIVRYMRPQEDRLLLAYAERVKIGVEARPLSVFLREKAAGERFRQYERLLRWREVFGENDILRAMVPAKLDRGNPVVDFLDALSESLPESWQPPEPSNESLSAQGLAQVARLQATLKTDDAALRHSQGYEFACLYGQLPDRATDQRIGFDADMAADLRATFDADASGLDRDRFGGEDIFASALLAGAQKAQSGEPDPLSLPDDPAGERVAESLPATIRDSGDPAALAIAWRNARYQHSVASATAVEAPVPPGTLST